MQYAHPRGWIKGEPMIDPLSRPFAITPLRIWVSNEPTPSDARLLSFVSAAARDEWLKWWSKK